jgi:hypothetical protein
VVCACERERERDFMEEKMGLRMYCPRRRFVSRMMNLSPSCRTEPILDRYGNQCVCVCVCVCCPPPVARTRGGDGRFPPSFSLHTRHARYIPVSQSFVREEESEKRRPPPRPGGLLAGVGGGRGGGGGGG